MRKGVLKMIVAKLLNVVVGNVNIYREKHYDIYSIGFEDLYCGSYKNIPVELLGCEIRVLCPFDNCLGICVK